MIEKGMKKGGEMYIFSPIGKSKHIFPSIDLKCTKLPKNGAHHLIIRNFILGKNINQEGVRGKNMNLKFNIHSCVNLLYIFVKLLSWGPGSPLFVSFQLYSFAL